MLPPKPHEALLSPPRPRLPAQHPVGSPGSAAAGHAGTPAGAEGSRALPALTFLCPGSFSLALEGLRRSMVLGPGGDGAAFGQHPARHVPKHRHRGREAPQEAGSHMRGACSGAARGGWRVRGLGQEEGNPPRSCCPARGPWGGDACPHPATPRGCCWWALHPSHAKDEGPQPHRHAHSPCPLVESWNGLGWKEP